MLMQGFFYNAMNVYNIIVRELYSTWRGKGWLVFGFEADIEFNLIFGSSRVEWNQPELEVYSHVCMRKSTSSQLDSIHYFIDFELLNQPFQTKIRVYFKSLVWIENLAK